MKKLVYLLAIAVASTTLMFAALATAKVPAHKVAPEKTVKVVPGYATTTQSPAKIAVAQKPSPQEVEQEANQEEAQEVEQEANHEEAQEVEQEANHEEAQEVEQEANHHDEAQEVNQGHFQEDRGQEQAAAKKPVAAKKPTAPTKSAAPTKPAPKK